MDTFQPEVAAEIDELYQRVSGMQPKFSVAEKSDAIVHPLQSTVGDPPEDAVLVIY